MLLLDIHKRWRHVGLGVCFSGFKANRSQSQLWTSVIKEEMSEDLSVPGSTDQSEWSSPRREAMQSATICSGDFGFHLSYLRGYMVHITLIAPWLLARGRQRKSDESGFILGDLKVADQADKISQAQENLGSDVEMTHMICQCLVSREVNSVILCYSMLF